MAYWYLAVEGVGGERPVVNRHGPGIDQFTTGHVVGAIEFVWHH